MAFTEFYCNASTGSNMNGGSDENTSPSYSATNGGWDSTTGVFTPTAGDPSASVSVGQFASVFTDGATTPAFVGRVTAVDATTITVSTTDKAGTAPTTAGSGISINVGGAWKGPNGDVAFPFAFANASLKGSAGDYPRINFKNNAAYNTSAAITHNQQGALRFEGYAATPGDGGHCLLDGTASGAGFTVLTVNGNNNVLAYFRVANSGATSGNSSDGIALTGEENIIYRCVASNIRRSGFRLTGKSSVAIECEAYSCLTGNPNDTGAIHVQGDNIVLIRCFARDNVTTTAGNGNGFFMAAGVYKNCIAAENSGAGFRGNPATSVFVLNCDTYKNGGHGILSASTTQPVLLHIENCNLIQNGGYGISDSGSGSRNGFVFNCGFGSGTQANVSGTIDGLTAPEIVGSVTYPANATPWVDPDDGDFRINLAEAKNAGRGYFTQTAAGQAGAVGYPDIGSAQHLDTGGGGDPSVIIFNSNMKGGMQ